MVRSLALSAVVLALLASPSMANSCVEPYAPAMPNGTTATLDQMGKASKEANQFMRDSQDYQDCIWRDLGVQRAEAARRQKELDPSVEDEVRADGDRVQREKLRVKAEFEAALAAFKAAHPGAAQ